MKKTKSEQRDLVLIRVFRGGQIVAWDLDDDGNHREVRELRVEQFRHPEEAERLAEIGRRRAPDGELFAQGIPGGWWRWDEMLPALRQIYDQLEGALGPIRCPSDVEAPAAVG